MGHNLVNIDANMKMAFILDDINMPRVDNFGARPTNELIRYYSENAGWYDKQTLKWHKVEQNPVICISSEKLFGQEKTDPRFSSKFMK
jgi:dynein heavy chain